jgi:hypothetical protein
MAGVAKETRTTARALRRVWTDIAALVLTPLVWPLGVALLWSSSAWSRSDKLAGSLVTPGGLFLPWLAINAVRRGCPADAGGGPCQATPTYSILHPTTTLSPPGSPAFDHVFGSLVVVLLIALPLLSALHLARRRRSRSTSS